MDVDSCGCEDQDEGFRTWQGQVRLWKTVYDDFEDDCGRENLLVLRWCNQGQGKDYGNGMGKDLV